ncbi:hypothetical protein PFMC_02238 [Plasmodium falciparum CAMP/Malaysia]|uniref:Uncharacterized protein n=1 Tax=Plasmodium falciparum (isolate Camp / Malaysia) TaxID=5835 RepID=A0A024X9B1_PLAFC|nr:hypothetical protein PFMC_02238 [Plasmodium falciparum CAMP/Malaysia]
MDILECRMLISLTSMVYVPFIEVYFFYNEVKITQAIAANERHAATKETTETTNTLMLEKTNKIAGITTNYSIVIIASIVAIFFFFFFLVMVKTKNKEKNYNTLNY